MTFSSVLEAPGIVGIHSPCSSCCLVYQLVKCCPNRDTREMGNVLTLSKPLPQSPLKELLPFLLVPVAEACKAKPR